VCFSYIFFGPFYDVIVVIDTNITVPLCVQQDGRGQSVLLLSLLVLIYISIFDMFRQVVYFRNSDEGIMNP